MAEMDEPPRDETYDGPLLMGKLLAARGEIKRLRHQMERLHRARPLPILAGVSAKRFQWAEQFGRQITLDLANGNYSAAFAGCERARREDPDRGIDLRSLSVAERRELPLIQFLTTRTSNYLEERRIFTVGDVLEVTGDDITAIPGVGPKVLLELDAMFVRVDIRWTKRTIPAARRYGETR